MTGIANNTRHCFAQRHWCLNRHLCILQERFAKKKDLNHKFGHCILQFICKLSLVPTNYTWLERGDSQL